MVDPITAAGAGAAAVFAQKVLEEAASQTGQALSAGTRRLVAWIRHRGDEDPKTGAAVAMVSADPIDQDSIDMLSRVLAARVAGDPELVRQLQELVADAPEAVTVRDQAQVGMIISGSAVGGQGGHGPAGGGGGWRGRHADHQRGRLGRADRTARRWRTRRELPAGTGG
jgi:hypothetical protein